jgi:hypothetical protein
MGVCETQKTKSSYLLYMGMFGDELSTIMFWA